MTDFKRSIAETIASEMGELTEDEIYEKIGRAHV